MHCGGGLLEQLVSDEETLGVLDIALLHVHQLLEEVRHGVHVAVDERIELVHLRLASGHLHAVCQVVQRLGDEQEGAAGLRSRLLVHVEGVHAEDGRTEDAREDKVTQHHVAHVREALGHLLLQVLAEHAHLQREGVHALEDVQRELLRSLNQTIHVGVQILTGRQLLGEDLKADRVVADQLHQRTQRLLQVLNADDLDVGLGETKCHTVVAQQHVGVAGALHLGSDEGLEQVERESVRLEHRDQRLEHILGLERLTEGVHQRQRRHHHIADGLGLVLRVGDHQIQCTQMLLVLTRALVGLDSGQHLVDCLEVHEQRTMYNLQRLLLVLRLDLHRSRRHLLFGHGGHLLEERTNRMQVAYNELVGRHHVGFLATELNTIRKVLKDFAHQDETTTSLNIWCRVDQTVALRCNQSRTDETQEEEATSEGGRVTVVGELLQDAILEVEAELAELNRTVLQRVHDQVEGALTGADQSLPVGVQVGVGGQLAAVHLVGTQVARDLGDERREEGLQVVNADHLGVGLHHLAGHRVATEERARIGGLSHLLGDEGLEQGHQLAVRLEDRHQRQCQLVGFGDLHHIAQRLHHDQALFEQQLLEDITRGLALEDRTVQRALFACALAAPQEQKHEQDEQQEHHTHTHADHHTDGYTGGGIHHGLDQHVEVHRTGLERERSAEAVVAHVVRERGGGVVGTHLVGHAQLRVSHGGGRADDTLTAPGRAVVLHDHLEEGADAGQREHACRHIITLDVRGVQRDDVHHVHVHVHKHVTGHRRIVHRGHSQRNPALAGEEAGLILEHETHRVRTVVVLVRHVDHLAARIGHQRWKRGHDLDAQIAVGLTSRQLR
mmetsp:Transcript_10802/g.33127  ORF Transcript_10802/g.33127 Transcript_10802/m.33127 type:complete len:840 (-) Transcript_10802:6721-9240(-)